MHKELEQKVSEVVQQLNIAQEERIYKIALTVVLQGKTFSVEQDFSSLLYAEQIQSAVSNMEKAIYG